MAPITTLTRKGQVTIPKEIRDTFGLRPYDKIKFTVENGTITLEKAYPSLEDVAGSLPANKLGISVEEAIELAWEERAHEVLEKMKSW